MKSENQRQTDFDYARDEAAWKKEITTLRRTALEVWHELLTIESFYCVEIKAQVDFFEEVRRFEIRLIKSALLRNGGNQKKAARLLGISVSTLNYKIKRHRIPVSTALRNLSFNDS